MNKKLHHLLTALAVWITCALAASAADTYDFTYADLQYVITSSNTAKVVGHEAPSPVGSYNIYGTATMCHGMTTVQLIPPNLWGKRRRTNWACMT